MVDIFAGARNRKQNGDLIRLLGCASSPSGIEKADGPVEALVFRLDHHAGVVREYFPSDVEVLTLPEKFLVYFAWNTKGARQMSLQIGRRVRDGQIVSFPWEVKNWELSDGKITGICLSNSSLNEERNFAGQNAVIQVLKFLSL